MKSWVRSRLFYIMAALAVIVGLSACRPTPVPPLKMALIPAEEASVELERYKPIAKYLEKEIGRPIELTVATDYSAVIEALKFGHADMARLGPFSYVLATTQARVEAIARGIKKKTGKDAYHAYIISRADSDVKSLEDIKGKTFAFVDPASTSGYLIPNALFAKAGMDPEKDFKEVFFAGTHGAVIEAVKNKTVDAGAVADNRFQDALDAGVIEEGELAIIVQSDSIPNSPITVRSDLPEDLKKKIQAAWLALPVELTEEAAGVLGYVPAKDSDYDFIREVAKVLDLDLAKMK